MLLLSLIPELSTIVPPHRSSSSATGNTATKRSFRALDAGAGIGRVTSTVLLPLFHRVDLVEPVGKFLQEAEAAARKSSDDGWRLLASNTGAAEITKGTRGVRLWQAGLQYFDPSRPAVALAGGSSTLLATVSNAPQSISFPDPSLPITVEEGYDIVMIQWCVGHLSDEDFIAFLQRSQKVLRQENGELKGFIIVKENTCKDTEVGGQLFDDEDSSITRCALYILWIERRFCVLTFSFRLVQPL